MPNFPPLSLRPTFSVVAGAVRELRTAGKSLNLPSWPSRPSAAGSRLQLVFIRLAETCLRIMTPALFFLFVFFCFLVEKARGTRQGLASQRMVCVCVEQTIRRPTAIVASLRGRSATIPARDLLSSPFFFFSSLSFSIARLLSFSSRAPFLSSYFFFLGSILEKEPGVFLWRETVLRVPISDCDMSTLFFRVPAVL